MRATPLICGFLLALAAALAGEAGAEGNATARRSLFRRDDGDGERLIGEFASVASCSQADFGNEATAKLTAWDPRCRRLER